MKLTAAGRRSIDPGGVPADSKQHPPSIPVNDRMRDSLYPPSRIFFTHIIRLLLFHIYAYNVICITIQFAFL